MEGITIRFGEINDVVNRSMYYAYVPSGLLHALLQESHGNLALGCRRGIISKIRGEIPSVE